MPMSHASQWWDSPLGQHLLEQERALLDPVVHDVFGYHAVQLGLPEFDLLRESRIQKRAVVGPEGGEVRARPFSLWGLQHFLGRGYPWGGRYIAVPRLHDWLQLLDLETTGGRYTAYTPPLQSPLALSRWAFMEKAGDRWWPMAGGVYLLQAVKRVRGLRVLQGQPLRRSFAKPVLVATGRNQQRVGDGEAG
ncbi:MAG: hypothetical protein EBS54_04500 [Betaproteobacteria bacterium]|nr:hypothetical protein [Betaproteobacteria bacterium]